MSLIFVDSFDHYATAQILSKYTSMTSGLTIVASGRNGTSCLVNASGSDRFVNRSVGNKQTLIIGFAVYFISTLAQRSLLQVLDSGTIQLDFRINLFVILFGLFFSFGLGIVAGILPAIRASRLTPVTALRYE